MQRETDLPEMLVGTISVVSLVEGQFLLVLRRHSGDRHDANREVYDVVQARVGATICRRSRQSRKIISRQKTQAGRSVM